MKLTEQYDGYTFWHSWKVLKMLKMLREENWIDVLSRPTVKPRMEYCEDQHGTIICTRALQGRSHGVAIDPDLFSLKQTPLNWKEHIFHTGSSSNCKSIPELHKTSLFFLISESARIVIATAYDRLDM